jgi:hypothetical protein
MYPWRSLIAQHAETNPALRQLQTPLAELNANGRRLESVSAQLYNRTTK